MAYSGPPPAYSYAPPTDQGVVFSPNIPYIGPLAPLSDGYMITISGRVLPKADRFHVNLSLGAALNEKCETAFHINPRFVDRTVVRNSFIGRSWAAEERGAAGFPLNRDENFEMIILVTNPCYKVAFNGKHFCEFNHRTPKESVTHLVIEGDVMVHQIKITDPRRPVGQAPPAPPFAMGPVPPAPGPQGYLPPQGYPPPPPQGVAPAGYAPPHMPLGQGYPPPPGGAPGYPPLGSCIPGGAAQAPTYPVGQAAPPPSTGYPPPGPPRQHAAPKPSVPVPHLQGLRRGVEAGQVIRIHGKPKLNAKEMRFDFLCNNQDLIAFHFNPRFREKLVVRNSYSGQWGKEERQQPKFPFLPDKEFDMIIYCDPAKYQVTIDGENFINFNHRIRNLANVRYLKISGDIELYRIQM